VAARQPLSWGVSPLTRFPRGFTGTLLAASLAVAAAYLTTDVRQPQAATAPSPAPTAVEGELLVRYRPGTPAYAQRFMTAMGALSETKVGELGVLRLHLRRGLSTSAAGALYRTMPGVEFAEPNYVYHAADNPNDLLYPSQRWYYTLVEAPQAWDIETGDPSVLVAILDSGVDASHPDLAGKVWRNDGEVSGDGIDNDGNGCVDDVIGCNFLAPSEADPSCGTPRPALTGQVNDDAGHGTFVAGIIAAATNNGQGVASVARGARVMPVKVLDCTGAGTAADAALGLLYAVRMGARVVNFSFGGEQDSFTFREAVRLASEQFGAVMVAASGNEGKEGVTFPAGYPQVIAVGATARNSPDERAPFSNWGPEVDMAAPGVDLVSTVPAALCGNPWACAAGEPYARASGTSFAAPQVAAAAALLVSRSPSMTPAEVLAALRSTAQPLPEGSTPGWAGAGRVRMGRALAAALFRLGAPGIARN